jgi:RNA polymerase sigma-70 factor, ECF subfamily
MPPSRRAAPIPYRGKKPPRLVANITMAAGSVAEIEAPTLLPRDDEWVAALRPGAPGRDDAVARLHALLLRTARFEISRRRESLAHVRGEELDDVACQAADDALIAVLGKLDDFRGASRFTTWAYKFALLEAGVRLRRRAWQDREVVLADEGWRAFADAAESPETAVARREVLVAIRDAIAGDLTEHQRRVLVALTLDGVPIDVLAERLGTTRGALYKTLHDARRRLRAGLAARGLTLEVS